MLAKTKFFIPRDGKLFGIVVEHINLNVICDAAMADSPPYRLFFYIDLADDYLSLNIWMRYI